MIVNELISRAYSFSQIVGRDLESVDGSQGADGLFLLNQLLASKSATGDEIPYYDNITVDTTAGVSEYFVEDLISIDAITFLLGTVRYPMVNRGRRKFWGDARVENIQNLPFSWYWQRVPGGMKIYTYFATNQNTPLKISGQLALTDVGQDDDLNTTLDKFYQNFLIFDLANYICMWNGISTPSAVQAELLKLKKEIYRINPPDYTNNRMSVFKSADSLNYASVNLGRGWTVPS